MTDSIEIRSGVYFDSVALMQVSARVKSTPGISDALIGMGTPLNLDLMREVGFDVADGAAPTDLVIAVRGETEEALEAARSALDAAFAELAAAAAAAGGPLGGDSPPLTLGSAARRTGAGLAVVSVPGEYAAVEVRHPEPWDPD